MSQITKLPVISEEQRTPLVAALIEIIHFQQEQIQLLKDEIARLKGQKPEPEIRPSTLGNSSRENKEEDIKPESEKRPGSGKKEKTKELEIHETKTIRPDHIPEGSRFKDYNDYVVRDIVIRSHNILYRPERWETPDKKYIAGELPKEIAGSHFGPTLIGYILHQYHHAHVTQPLIVEELREFGTDISSGQVNRIITEGKEEFHAEKKEILLAGLGVSEYINADDTGARHKGKNGYRTHIGNELFAWSESTESKSRINFLRLLSAGNVRYVINSDAIIYMTQQGLGKALLLKISESNNTFFMSGHEWKRCPEGLGVTSERHIRIASEGALYANVPENGFNPKLVILSDDAGQFDVFLHALCRVHTERIINRLVGFSEEQRQALEQKRSEIWDYYAKLKEYKTLPDEQKKAELQARFDEIFTGNTCFASLNQALKRIHKNKSELLLVPDRPEIPLHNHKSENDIREYVKKRKISGPTRSDSGRKCRDTFASLKKTCRKHGISFWKFLEDRIRGKREIPFLPDLIYLRARQSSA